jgi:putative SOS response-associated peptidase YedK
MTFGGIVNLYRLTLPEEPPKDRTGRELAPNFNVAPTQIMPIIQPAGNGRELVMAGWGLVPFWMKPEQLSRSLYSTINARSEGIQTAPTYREPFKQRRCIVPATGWYEWHKSPRFDRARRVAVTIRISREEFINRFWPPLQVHALPLWQLRSKAPPDHLPRAIYDAI